nr:A1 peptide [Vigna angularis=azuki-beans, cv Dainagon, seeds, Peptide Partial, 12 aa] [Vigna angularis]
NYVMNPAYLLVL